MSDAPPGTVVVSIPLDSSSAMMPTSRWRDARRINSVLPLARVCANIDRRRRDVKRRRGKRRNENDLRGHALLSRRH
jgi:hypothetical protein